MNRLLLKLALLLSTVVLSAETTRSSVALPPFTGTWKLNMSKSKLQAAHPPVASTASIFCDGKHWHYKRTHTYKDGKSETWSIDLDVNSNLTHMEKDGPLTFFSKIHREGDALVLVEDIEADNGEKAKNTVRYSLLNNGRILEEVEHKQTPKGNELNRWVFERQ